MHRHIVLRYFIISFILALTLAGCGKKPASSAQTQPDSQAAFSEAESSSPGVDKPAVLYIGTPDQLKEAAVENAATAEELIAALAKETGWNLTLAGPPVNGELPNTKVIAFAGDSAIYNAPPDPQKEDYHVFDSEDYVLTVLNSVSETLCRNLNLDGVYFTAPDGGVLTLENGGYSFCYSNIYCFNYSFAKECNQPVPEDELGGIFAAPSNDDAIEGPITLSVIFQRPNVQIGTGDVTIYNGDGSVREVISIRDSQKVQVEEVTDQERNYYNLKSGEGTAVRIFPTEDFEAGKNYSVSVSGGAFTADGGLKSEELSKDAWSFGCLDMKVAVTPKLGHKPVIKVGEPVTYHFEFSDEVSRVYVQEPKDGADYSCPVKELTSDGDIVFTPNKPGSMTWSIVVKLKDGNTASLSETLTVTE